MGIQSEARMNTGCKCHPWQKTCTCNLQPNPLLRIWGGLGRSASIRG